MAHVSTNLQSFTTSEKMKEFRKRNKFCCEFLPNEPNLIYPRASCCVFDRKQASMVLKQISHFDSDEPFHTGKKLVTNTRLYYLDFWQKISIIEFCDSKGPFTYYVTQMGWVCGQQKRYYCKVQYGQPNHYYGQVGGQKTVKSALRNL